MLTILRDGNKKVIIKTRLLTKQILLGKKLSPPIKEQLCLGHFVCRRRLRANEFSSKQIVDG